MPIRPARPSDQDTIFNILSACRSALEAQGIFQWIDAYPTPGIVADDIRAGHLFVLHEGDQIIGVVTLNDVQEDAYRSVAWQGADHPVLVVHRLAVHPACQGQGHAGRLMDFAEQQAVESGASIRLDAYSANAAVLRFYERRGYVKRGEVAFPGRSAPFYCYEKGL